MKTLQFVFLTLLSTSFFVACNNTNNKGEEGTVEVVDSDRMDDHDGAFSDWDTDRDDNLSRNEFDNAFKTDDFDRYDADKDGILDDNELGEGVFERGDKDKNGILSESERNTIWDDKPGADIADWDRDGNKEMDREEFRQIFSMKTNFKDWDENADGKLDKTEYTNRMYRRMDANNDGIISKSEFNEEHM